MELDADVGDAHFHDFAHLLVGKVAFEFELEEFPLPLGKARDECGEFRFFLFGNGLPGRAGVGRGKIFADGVDVAFRFAAKIQRAVPADEIKPGGEPRLQALEILTAQAEEGFLNGIVRERGQ